MSRIGTTATALLCVLVVTLPACGGVAWAQSPDVRPPIVMVSRMTVGRAVGPYRNPSVAVSRRGSLTVVAEAGPADQRHLEITDVTFGSGWSQPLTVSLAGPGDCRDPFLAYDTSGTLHLVWAQAIGRAYAVRCATQTPDGLWHDQGALSQTPDLDCLFPQVAVGRTGRIWVAWQAGWASQSNIYLALSDDGTTFAAPVAVTGDRSNTQNLYPQLFLDSNSALNDASSRVDSPYPLVWYEETATGFRLQAAVPNESGQGLQTVAPLEFDRLNANLMPRVFQAPSGMLGGVWTDLVGNRARTLVGFQDPASLGEGIVLGAGQTADAEFPSAIAVDDKTVAVVWVNRTPEGCQIMAGRVSGTTVAGPVLVCASPTDGAMGRPCLVVTAGGVVHCVWASDPARGGSGDLQYAALMY